MKTDLDCLSIFVQLQSGLFGETFRDVRRAWLAFFSVYDNVINNDIHSWYTFE